MRPTLAFLAALAAAFSLGSPPAAQAQAPRARPGAPGAPVAPGDWEIVPGRRIGKVFLDADTAAVRAALGRPTETRRRPGGLVEERWVSKRKDVPEPPYVAVLLKSGRVVQVEVNSPRFKTRSGTSTDSSFREIRRTYANLKVTEYHFEDYIGLYYDDVAAGVAFFVGAQEQIYPQFQPQAILIHLPGARVLPAPGGKSVPVEDDLTLMK